MLSKEPITTPALPSPDLDDPSLYINRELSWLEFNQRCLAEATDSDLPLLERIRFLSIFSNNLDEYYMVRVSGLKDQVRAGVIDTTPDGIPPHQQLAKIRERVLPLQVEQRRCFYEDIVPRLEEQNIHILTFDMLSNPQRRALRDYFERDVFPVLTPLAVD